MRFIRCIAAWPRSTSSGSGSVAAHSRISGVSTPAGQTQFDANAVGGQLERERFRQRDQRALRRHVDRAAVLPDKSGHRGDRHDRPAASPQRGSAARMT